LVLPGLASQTRAPQLTQTI